MLVAHEDNGQQLRIEADRKGGKRITGYEYAVLVTNLDHEILSLGRSLPRPGRRGERLRRASKNRAGAPLPRTTCIAGTVGARGGAERNWWSLFVRLANAAARLEGHHQPALVDVLGGGAPSMRARPRSRSLAACLLRKAR
ncbi:MAG: hypothetical protein H6946_05560 [Thauera sp.]|uniref:hypothetical protein n=1 Tax=Thauera sp. TaxID=1905334 RepID=UPI00261E61F1|nr:hypothetical protein [Thauera sp.]MCP5224595.1 hypothetical protein [Thauera sp.]